MDITFTIKITEQNIPQLIGLLGRMWDCPNPGETVTVVDKDSERTVTVNTETNPASCTVQAPADAAPARPTDEPTKPTAAQIQAAAGAFMDAAPGNIIVLQGILRDLGAKGLPELKAEQLEAFASKLREHGVAV